MTGAGSAGCVVASRLSKSGRYRVLLLEAGIKDSNPRIHVPIGYTKAYDSPRINWMFDSAAENELNGRTLHRPRDMHALIFGIRTCRTIAAQPALAP